MADKMRATVEDEWPTNAATVICTGINIILLIVTIIIYYSLISKSRRYLQIQDAIQHPNTPKNVARKRQATLSKQEPNTPTAKEVSINKYVLFGTIISCSFLLISNIATVLYTINSQFYVGGGQRTLTSLQIFGIGLAQIICHLVFIKRLRITFDNAYNLQYSRSVFIGLYGLLMAGILMIISCAVFFLIYHTKHAFVQISIIAFGGDLVLSIVMLLLFISKLKTVFMQRKKYVVQQESTNKPIEFQSPDQQLLGAITKLTLLCCFSALGSFFCLIVFIIRAIIESHHGKNFIFVKWKIIYSTNIMFILNGTMNCLALYLLLSITADNYIKACGCCHNFVQRCCKYGFKTALVRSRRRWLEASVTVHGDKIGTFDQSDNPELARNTTQNGIQTMTTFSLNSDETQSRGKEMTPGSYED